MKSIVRDILVGGGMAVTFGQAIDAGTEVPTARRGTTQIERLPYGPDNEKLRT